MCRFLFCVSVQGTLHLSGRFLNAELPRAGWRKGRAERATWLKSNTLSAMPGTTGPRVNSRCYCPVLWQNHQQNHQQQSNINSNIIQSHINPLKYERMKENDSISDVHCRGRKTAPAHRSCPSSCCSAARRFQCRNLTWKAHWCHLCSVLLFAEACNLFCAFHMHWQQHLWRGELKHFEWQRFFQSWGIDGHKSNNQRFSLWRHAYLINVIFFTQAKFLESKIYTEKSQFLVLNL